MTGYRVVKIYVLRRRSRYGEQSDIGHFTTLEKAEAYKVEILKEDIYNPNDLYIEWTTLDPEY